jgi:hypothetical protein
MTDKRDFILSRIESLEAAVKDIVNKPSQRTVDKAVEILTAKLNERDSQRDRIFDLELKNLSKSLLLEVKSTFKEAHRELELKIKESVSEALKTQKDKVSWTIEGIRFIIGLVMFVTTIKLVN